MKAMTNHIIIKIHKSTYKILVHKQIIELMEDLLLYQMKLTQTMGKRSYCCQQWHK